MFAIASIFLAPILSFLGTLLPGLATSIGDTVVRARQTEAARQGAQDQAGLGLGHDWLSAVTDGNRARAQARKEEGAWGPIGIITFMVGLPLVYHVWLVVLDSSPFYPTLVWNWYVVPWIGWEDHVVGSWRVAALPSGFQATELAIFQALYYVAPPAAAAVVVARAFRR